MKKSIWIVIIGVDLFVLTVMGVLGYYFNWWILWVTLMIHGGAGIGFLIYIIIKSRSGSKEELDEVKKTKITKDDCFNLLEEELLKPMYADMIRKVDYNRTENYGSDKKTPINVIKAFGYFERGVEYYWITNMNNPENPTLILFCPMNPMKGSREEFELELEDIKNKVADFPEQIEEIIQNPVMLPSGQSGMQTTRRRISREEAEKKKGEQAGEEAETLD